MRLLLVLLLLAGPAGAVPIVPSFQSGTLKSTTTTKTKLLETINSYEYNTGYEWAVGGTNVAPSGSLSFSGNTNSQTINGVTSGQSQLNLGNKPSFSVVNEGAPFDYFERYYGPGLSNHTHIIRETDSETITDSLSIFTQ